MTRRDYWIGVIVVAAAIVCHMAFPRYTLVTIKDQIFRVDRWFGLPVGTSLTDSRYCAATFPTG